MATHIRFHPISWRSKVIQKRSTYNLTINKLVADGCNIQKGDVLHSYIGEDHELRPIMITYLDGRPRAWTNADSNVLAEQVKKTTIRGEKDDEQER